MFSTALNFLGNHSQSAQGDDDIDQDRISRSHQQLYQQGGGGQQHDASTLGAGAAAQALKLFAGGGGGGGGQGTSGGSSQSQMVSLAMSEAAKLFDSQSSQGNVASGTNKQSVINQAAKM
jgi:hypothetical protein